MDIVRYIYPRNSRVLLFGARGASGRQEVLSGAGTVGEGEDEGRDGGGRVGQGWIGGG